MVAFKPYKFIIFNKNLRNNNFYKQIITFLDLSVLCKEIYLSEKFCKLNYEHVSRKKLIYFSDSDLVDKLNQNHSYSHSHNQNELISTIRNEQQCLPTERDSVNTHNFVFDENIDHNMREGIIETEDLIQKKKTEQENGVLTRKGNRNKKGDQFFLVSLFIYEGKKKEELLNMINFIKMYNVNHINILCLNDYNSILNLFNKQQAKTRISIFCPFYIVHDNYDMCMQNVPKKICDFLYTIISDFLPLNYKHVYLSDLIRAIIVNTELCQGNADQEIEVLRFMDMMQIIGKL
ncbi:conserved Plasmodium protein, unknown function [Plasmodium malariae]|uniref:Uncharacterized protein n=1 Tax=Plasmodium malariae TaxID=5858 RepID=A0A1C3KY17_PLAMA|nr:conserved Plasmodium protein, unknown function [Plasmodium malariae]